ncbi:IS3 family transposase [Cytobacillus praedii]|uniref:IS3 family transposase n=1 Tax=Cytobacillus praedii TaxID=1742358 RepID=UPI00399D525C
MSRKGNLKTECFNLHSYISSQEVRMAIKDYILFYHHERFQIMLNNLTPIKYRSQAF